MELHEIHPHLKLDNTKNQLVNTNTNEIIKLEPRLVELLQHLIEGQGNVVPREILIKAIWGDYNSGDQLLTHSISILRKAIGYNLIKTVPKHGYLIEKPSKKFTPRVKWRISNLQLVGYVLLLTFVIKVLFFSHH
ncbi:Transcriptional regulatory protein, C terminal [Ekhidna lutea]|uniref:Transcriptional regulatory protein, C terminal n=1 Tax=Ekhidna lutea TaxID=447679 RepID=A0A239H9L6_EKHLU|nr:winged helix-turn-helix domain-containing protein [Ekhidna lutea]SNS78116.1 Transcriptional regulatory protein, C terminal [Ekhidna lutea]